MGRGVRLPVGDLGQFLTGTWQVRRLVCAGGPVRLVRFQGTASFIACEAGLAFHEQGMMVAGGYAGEASRRMVFHFETAEAAMVSFADGRFFHRVDLRTGFARVEHDCPPDRYEGRYRVLTPACWLLSWRVMGPRKNQAMTSRFQREGLYPGAHP